MTALTAEQTDLVRRLRPLLPGIAGTLRPWVVALARSCPHGTEGGVHPEACPVCHLWGTLDTALRCLEEAGAKRYPGEAG